jgi:serine/threonine-protein kinase
MPDTPPSKSEPTPKLPPPPIPDEKGDTPSVGSVLDFGELGAYTLEERLGSGGMGEVYRARQVGARGFSQTVAIKRLRRERRRSHEQSFVDEARVLSRLHHEHIAGVYAFIEHQGSQYLVMEYIEGHSLYALLELARHKGYRFPEPMACTVMADVADALNYAHEATDEAGQPLHIVHRDVSPVNILITKTGRTVLVDFGVAHSKLDGRKATGEGGGWFKGKAPYLSPEQVERLPLDGRSDLFAVGTILVEMLTGYAPFGTHADYSTLLRIGKVTPEFVAALLSGVSPELIAICQKLLARKPDERFANGREVALALRRHAGLYDSAAFVQAEVAKLQVLPEGKPLPPPPPPPFPFPGRPAK